ncbi:hypothetical protein [Candidatus Uabimicrobium sp. HlEnr_7]|uniref:hypothetical protein n=1 Tax=Candidatus Uabimicrobium helgolandensis TaxID=3095367 RepID=UPI0035568BCE
MEYIIVCLILLAFIYFVVFSGRGKSKPSNPYDAFAMTGIGRGVGNGVFRSRKIKKNKKPKEFYITGEIAGAVLSEKLEPEFEVVPVTEPYNTDKKNKQLDSCLNPLEKEQLSEKEQPPEKINNNDFFSIDDEKSDDLVREILAQEKLSKKEIDSFVPPQNQNRIDKDLVEALEQVHLEEELQRKKTDDEFLGQPQRKSSTGRYFAKGESVVETSKEKEQDILASLGIDELLKEVNQIKEQYNGQSQPQPSTLNYNDDSDDSDEEINSVIFQKKVNNILSQLPDIEDLKESKKPSIKVEKLWTSKRNYERSQAVDEWRAKLGLKNLDDI